MAGGPVWSARFAPDGQMIVYAASWDGAQKPQLYSVRAESPESLRLALPPGQVASISSNGEMLILNLLQFSTGYARIGTLSQTPLSGSTPRDLLEDVGHADWSPDGAAIAVVRAPQWRYRLEFPAGKVLYETTGWISSPADLSEGRRGGVPRPPALRRRPRQCRDRGSVGKEDDAFDRMGERAGCLLVGFRRGDLVHGDAGRQLPRPLRRHTVGTPARSGEHTVRDVAAGHLSRRARALRREQCAARIPRPAPRGDEGAGSLGSGVVLWPAPVRRTERRRSSRSRVKREVRATPCTCASWTGRRRCGWARDMRWRFPRTESGC